jgi:hypothetical protein
LLTLIATTQSGSSCMRMKADRVCCTRSGVQASYALRLAYSEKELGHGNGGTVE